MTDQNDHQTDGNPELIAAIRAEIATGNGMTFARYMELALYHPDHGYYVAAARRPGRGGDFLTAPELHPLFGLTIARQVAECFDLLGETETLTILEYGSGIGGLAYDVIVGLLDANPALRTRLRYRLNEVNPYRMAQALSAMDEVGLGDIVDPDDAPAPVVGVILANEVADAMPVHRLRWRDGVFQEAWVHWSDREGFHQVFGELSAEVLTFDPVTYLTRAGVDLAALPEGALLEVSPATGDWVREIAARLERGYALLIDYGYPAPELYRDHRLESTLRVHANHTVTENPYDGVGERDLTAHVDFSAMMEVARKAGLAVAGLTTQSDFLSNAGLGGLLVDMQQQPETGLEEYYRAQSSVFRLIDPSGLGRFRVLGLSRGMTDDVPLMGFSGPELPESLRI